MDRETRRTFCRIVGQLLVSDLQLHDSEVRYLDDLYHRLGISQQERSEIQREVNVGDDVCLLAATLPKEARKELLSELHDAAWADGVLVGSEAKIIKAIEELLASAD